MLCGWDKKNGRFWDKQCQCFFAPTEECFFWPSLSKCWLNRIDWLQKRRCVSLPPPPAAVGADHTPLDALLLLLLLLLLCNFACWLPFATNRKKLLLIFLFFWRKIDCKFDAQTQTRNNFRQTPLLLMLSINCGCAQSQLWMTHTTHTHKWIEVKKSSTEILSAEFGRTLANLFYLCKRSEERKKKGEKKSLCWLHILSSSSSVKWKGLRALKVWLAEAVCSLSERTNCLLDEATAAAATATVGASAHSTLHWTNSIRSCMTTHEERERERRLAVCAPAVNSWLVARSFHCAHSIILSNSTVTQSVRATLAHTHHSSFVRSSNSTVLLCLCCPINASIVLAVCVCVVCVEVKVANLFFIFILAKLNCFSFCFLLFIRRLKKLQNFALSLRLASFFGTKSWKPTLKSSLCCVCVCMLH